MNNRYLCKAKTETGEWVEGLPSYGPKGEITQLELQKPYDDTNYFVNINPDTLCQCTGRTCGGEKIFEHDIISLSQDNCYAAVEWIEEGWKLIVDENVLTDLSEFSDSELDIIGNRFDHPAPAAPKSNCGNCKYFNGEDGDGEQFCDELEAYVHETWHCNRYKERISTWKEEK